MNFHLPERRPDRDRRRLRSDDAPTGFIIDPRIDPTAPLPPRQRVAIDDRGGNEAETRPDLPAFRLDEASPFPAGGVALDRLVRLLARQAALDPSGSTTIERKESGDVPSEPQKN